MHVRNGNLTMTTSLNYSISSEIESTEKSLNQRNPILLIILRIVPITLKNMARNQIDYQHKKSNCRQNSQLNVKCCVSSLNKEACMLLITQLYLRK